VCKLKRPVVCIEAEVEFVRAGLKESCAEIQQTARKSGEPLDVELDLNLVARRGH
jgi:hypothetical protein